MQFDMIFFLIKYKIEIIYRHTIPLKRQANKLEETWEESTDVKVRVSLQLRFSKKATKIWQKSLRQTSNQLGDFCQIFVAFIEKLNFSWVALCVHVCFFLNMSPCYIKANRCFENYAQKLLNNNNLFLNFIFFHRLRPLIAFLSVSTLGSFVKFLAQSNYFFNRVFNRAKNCQKKQLWNFAIHTWFNIT